MHDDGPHRLAPCEVVKLPQVQEGPHLRHRLGHASSAACRVRWEAHRVERCVKGSSAKFSWSVGHAVRQTPTTGTGRGSVLTIWAGYIRNRCSADARGAARREGAGGGGWADGIDDGRAYRELGQVGGPNRDDERPGEAAPGGGWGEDLDEPRT